MLIGASNKGRKLNLIYKIDIIKNMININIPTLSLNISNNINFINDLSNNKLINIRYKKYLWKIHIGAIYIYNTLTKKKEIFEPIEYPFVRIYHCGITPYDYSHIGHLRAEVSIDIIRRILRFFGYIDIAISNFTDIDDKIINRANELATKDWQSIPRNNIRYHLEQIKRLNNLPFYINPLVTEHINEISEFVKDLIDKGYAYTGKYSIYFDVDKYKDYGKLSGNKKEYWDQETNVLEDKKNPYDFALWKFKKDGEPYWKTIIGEGRPGWHIECSTMSSRYLGKQFDIHSGAQDLIFPHHENEIAQSEARFNINPWVKYWIHVGLLKIKGEKMSKSLKNIIPAKDFIDKYGPEIVRFYFASYHYREPIDVNEDSIEQAKKNYNYIESTIKIIVSNIGNLERTFYLDQKNIEIFNNMLKYEKEFIDNLRDDFNIGKATVTLLELTKYINRYVINSNIFTLYYKAYEFYKNASIIYGLWENIFCNNKDNNINQIINLLIDIRKDLRDNRLYNLSDKIRNRLKELGIELLDSGDKTIYKFS
ncbi:cysteine--tRNA ligase [Nanobdella aerobiophila]|uniref:Cysteine--tRNA ligase n=1 Tax=Nanobdella aerobiophila TaxID=2586965 RepID=A0A915SKH3_9ARCH|nr:cysteine--tRNA ligase [Nanobdella aerobiophila]BBL45638.1 cysteine--tRNA ligase [Nanobdella aerobiophila]